MKRSRRNPFGASPRKRRRLSPFMLVGVLVSLGVAVVGAVVFVLPRIGSHAAAVNGDCTLVVPAQPLTATGLATPYKLMATDPANGPCNEANGGQAAFVQAAVFDPATNSISVYNPLVIDNGTQPAMAPVVPQIPAQAIVGIWFGFNGNNLTLQNQTNSLRDGKCVNGTRGSIFGQVSYCNAPAFFQAANQAIQAGKLVPPQLGKAKDGLTCPTVRDFSVVDQDQSDNVTTSYLVLGNGQTAQMNKANATALQNSQVQTNGSDNRLLSIALDGALGCTPWMAPDLADPGQMVTALPLDELQAAAHQAQPVALVPAGDPMTLVNGNTSFNKVNLYRAGVDQPAVQFGTMNNGNTRTYCSNLLAVAPARLQLDARLTKGRPSADPAVANSLFTFLAQRFVNTFEANGLNCAKLLGTADPVSVKTDGNGVAINATINGTTITTPMDCAVNGNVLVGCNGTTTINGVSCSFVVDRNAHQIQITCPAAQPQP
ncbi:MAG TPA: hypothetical protein VFQ36_10025 [Ktedonobacteraceae bacterium]|nr:hypothetical protein [Ktedonobacteraceae bacterium]